MTNTFTKKDQETGDNVVRGEHRLTILTQAFYGNRTMTEISPANIDRFILGYLDSSIKISGPIDRTIIRIPKTDNLVLVYNRYREEESLKWREELLRERNYERKPLAVIPELDLVLYSRCIALRINEDGSFASLQDGDCSILEKYLTE